MQRQPVEVSRDAIAGPVVPQVVLSFPGWVHDEVVRQCDDLEAHQTPGEERLENLIALDRLSRIIHGVCQEATQRSDKLLDTVAIALQYGVLEVKRKVARSGGSPIFALR